MTESSVAHHLPVQLTSFVGRRTEIAEVGDLLAEHRLVTLTGAGGVGKTRLAVQLSSELTGGFGDGVWFVDLAPVADAAVLALTVAASLGLPDQPGRLTTDVLLRFLGERAVLLVLDNCEQLLDACAALSVELLTGCPQLTILATSREPLGVPGELTWPVPSLSIADEATELFADRARHARPDFRLGEDNTIMVTEICARLDGIPLAIELAAARVRSLSLAQVVDGLHDRFRLLTGGARTALARHQTLRASVDWSHALLTETERVLFRRLGVFTGGFDLDAADAVGASTQTERHQLLDQLAQLVDKSLVLAEDHRGEMRYRLLETVRQYAIEKLEDSGEADAISSRHSDYYSATAALLASQGPGGTRQLIDWAETEIDNLRATYAWSRQTHDAEAALQLVSSLQQFWLARGRMREGLAGFDAVLDDERDNVRDTAPAAWVGAVADSGMLSALSLGASEARFGVASSARLELAEQALSTCRQLGDSALLGRILTACGLLAVYDTQVAAEQYFAEAIDVARACDDRWTLCQIRGYQAFTAMVAGDPVACQAAAEEGLEVAEALGERFMAGWSRGVLGAALYLQGDFGGCYQVLRPLAEQPEAGRDLHNAIVAHGARCFALSHQGKVAEAVAAADAGLKAEQAAGGLYEDIVYTAFATADLAGGDAVAAREAADTSWRCTVADRELFMRCYNPKAEVLLALGDLAEARRWADDTVAVVPGCHRGVVLTVRANIAIAQGEREQAECDAHEALAVAARTRGYLRLPDTLECLARLRAHDGNHQTAARLFGAADAMRQRNGQVRLGVYQAGYDAALGDVRNTLGQQKFDIAWGEGTALSTDEAIGYAQRGRGQRKRPGSGWEALTPTERDVVRLVSKGLANSEIASRLFVSPRTVQTHLRSVYAKLGLTSRVALVQEAARHN
jgi:predicted ATPase/DNA-binding CsgD family transcriptional regulator